VLDIKLIREKTDFVRQRLAMRGAGDEKLIDGILQADEQRRKMLVEVEALKSQRNRVSKEIGALMGQKNWRRPKPGKKRRAILAIKSRNSTSSPPRRTPTAIC